MEANSSVRLSLPVSGDFAAGVRTKPETLAARGDFATGMRGLPRAPARHHGDFGAGLRSRLHAPHVVAPGDFAIGLRTSESPASA